MIVPETHAMTVHSLLVTLDPRAAVRYPYTYSAKSAVAKSISGHNTRAGFSWWEAWGPA